MADQVSMSAKLKCSMGEAPSDLVVLPKNKVFGDGPIAANIMDHIPMVNIMPFGMCKSLANPMVAAATAANYGSLTKMPCTPVTPGPWTPGSPTVLLGGAPTLNNTSVCTCNWAGVIKITSPATTKIKVP